MDEKVLAGLVTTDEDYRKYIQNNLFVLDTDRLRKNWNEAKYVALYVKKTNNSKENGVKVYGKIEELKYVKNQVQFHVNIWRNLPDIIRPVNYGIASYVMTTLNTLLEAKELPELFMKSTEEMVLWRMLRRVSDRIKLDLDNPILDEAKEIKEYRIKDIRVQLFQGQNKLLFEKNNYKITMKIDDLTKRPTSVFKKMIELIQR